MEVPEGWESAEEYPILDMPFGYCSVDVDLLVPGMDDFGRARQDRGRGYYHFDANQWFIYEGAHETPSNSVLAWRYF